MKICEDLRRSILQAAIQGKLTQQKAEDGTAEDLLKKIKKEKEKLISEGKIKREKTLQPIKDDEIPFEIPENWRGVKLGSVISLISGADLTPDNYNSNGNGTVYITGASNINNGSIIINRWTTTPKNIAKFGDILLTCKGTVGANCILELEEAHIARQVMAIRVIIIDVKFVYYYLQRYVEILKKKAKSMIPGIERKNVNEALVPLPPLAEQHRIVKRVDALMSKINELEKVENELEAIKKKFPDDMRDALLQAAIQGKLTQQKAEDGTAEDLLKKIKKEKEKLISEGKIKREKTLPPIKDDEIPFEIPENWKWCRAGITLKVISGTSYEKKDICKEGLRILRGGNLVEEKILQEDDDVFLPIEYEDKEKQIQQNDIVIVASTGSLKGIGRAAFVDVKFDEAMQIGAFLRIIRPIMQNLFDYLKIIFSSRYYRNYISGIVNGIGIKNIRESHITNLLIPLPPIAEQHRIVKRLNELLPLCEAMKGE